MSKNNYPYALRLLRSFCPPDLREEIEGDLIQRFEKDLNPSDRLEPAYRTGRRSDGYWRRRANRRLVWNVIRFFRPGIILRNNFSIELNQFYMLSHFLKIFFRSSIKNATYSFINVTGLAFGLAGSIFIL